MKIDFKEQVVSKTDQELIAIFINPQDYQKNFIQIVNEELTRRNVNLKNYQQEKDRKQKITNETLERGRPGDPFYITLGFICAFLGGFAGVIVGYIYSQSKDKTASQYYVYNEETRKKGIIMMFIGFFVFIIVSMLGLR